MIVFITAFVSVVAFSWWYTIFIMRRNNQRLTGMPAWGYLIDELQSNSKRLNSLEELECYLKEIEDQVRKFETDYSFLVAYHSSVREIKGALGGREGQLID